MFQPGSRSSKGNYESSDSGSEWDTTEFGSTHPSRHDDVPSSAAVNRGLQHSPGPTPRIRVTQPGTDKADAAGDGMPGGPYEEETQPQHSARKNQNGGRLRSASPNLSLSADSVRDSGSRNPSPVPPYTSGFREALRDGDDVDKGEPPSPSHREQRSSRYDPAPSPRRQIPVDAENVPNWDDSDAEQQTLREVHTTFKKEKTREIENESARRPFPDEGKQGSASGPGTSVLEKWMHAREEKKQKNDQELSKSQRGGVSSLPNQWSRGGDFAIPDGGKAPYQSFIIKDGEGRRLLYVFNEGNTAFYDVEEEGDTALMSSIAEKWEKLIQRGLREFFGVLRIIVSVAIFLVVETTHFLTNHVARPIFLGVIVTVGNHLLKPVLAGVFSLILQPALIFLWNVFSGARNASRPLVDVLGSVMAKCAILLQSFRLVEVNWGSRGDDSSRGVRVVGWGRGAIGGEGEVV